MLVAQDELPDKQIAEAVGISERTLERWKRRPEFMARVQEHVAAWREAVRNEGIAVKEARIKAKVERHQALLKLIQERAADPALAGVPGGDTGLVLRTPLLVRVYEASAHRGRLTPRKEMEYLHVYQVDAATLRELRELEREIAIELGQWTERRELTGKDGGPIQLATWMDLVRRADGDAGEDGTE